LADENLKQAIDTAIGEAMFSSFVLTAVIEKLVLNGAIAREEVVNLADATLLILERHRTDPKGPGAAATDHARIRLEALLEHHSSRMPKGQES
jgi:hypothetical protein